MSLLMTIMGLAYGVWNLVLPGLSNRIGRKPVCALASAGGSIGLALLWIDPPSPIAPPLFVLFGGIASSTATFYLGLIPVESVPANVATASCALVVGASEAIGVALGPFLAGLIADRAGLPAAMGLAAGCMALSAVLSLALRETAGPNSNTSPLRVGAPVTSGALPQSSSPTRS
jgi:MFS family permease